jgi:hypothetical protein
MPLTLTLRENCNHGDLYRLQTGKLILAELKSIADPNTHVVDKTLKDHAGEPQ